MVTPIQKYNDKKSKKMRLTSRYHKNKMLLFYFSDIPRGPRCFLTHSAVHAKIALAPPWGDTSR